VSESRVEIVVKVMSAGTGRPWRAAFFSMHDPLKRRHTAYGETMGAVLRKVAEIEERYGAMTAEERVEAVEDALASQRKVDSLDLRELARSVKP